MAEYPQQLDIHKLSDESINLRNHLKHHIIGQDRAIEQFVKVFQQVEAGMNKPNRPAGVFLFMGPTGVGKTEVVRQTAQFLFGKKDAITRVDCGEFQHSHETAKLLGAPPGYVGYDAAHSGSARLSQKNIDQYQSPGHKLNIVLFDEIEEAHDAVYSAIIQILDAGRLVLGDNQEVDFTRTIIVMTSNLGERETQALIKGEGIGLKGEKVEQEKTDDQIYKLSKAAAVKHFHPKFMNRIDRLIVFRSLDEQSLKKILHNELKELELRVWRSKMVKWELDGRKEKVPDPFRVYVRTTEAADAFLLKEGTSKIYGARELNRAIDRFVSYPMGAVLGSSQITHGDVIQVDYEAEAKELKFDIIEHKDLKPLPPLQYNGTPLVDPATGVPTGLETPPEEKPRKRLGSSLCPHGKPKDKCWFCVVEGSKETGTLKPKPRSPFSHLLDGAEGKTVHCGHCGEEFPMTVRILELGCCPRCGGMWMK